MPNWLERAREDVVATIADDPAARGPVYVALTYPGLHAIWWHRLAHRWWQRGWHLAAQLVSMHARRRTGVEIHPGATIGRRLVIDHGMGTVIGETAVVGDDCLLYHGVTLGGRTLERGPRHPRLGNRVLVGAGATLLGAISVGDDAKVGAGALVTRDVAPGRTVIARPART